MPLSDTAEAAVTLPDTSRLRPYRLTAPPVAETVPLIAKVSLTTTASEPELDPVSVVPLPTLRFVAMIEPELVVRVVLPDNAITTATIALSLDQVLLGILSDVAFTSPSAVHVQLDAVSDVASTDALDVNVLPDACNVTAFSSYAIVTSLAVT